MAYSFYASGTPVLTCRLQHAPARQLACDPTHHHYPARAGKDRIRLGAIHPTRDFNYVQDTARGFLRSEAGIGETINSSNYQVLVGRTVELIAELMGKTITIESDEQRLRQRLGVVVLLADNDNALRLLGWQPEFGGLE
jgi:dTDP-glucose 4,6-dehydratase